MHVIHWLSPLACAAWQASNTTYTAHYMYTVLSHRARILLLYA
jgi:hypothetical protein